VQTFSERNGFVQPSALIQVNDLDVATRTKLWNVVHVIVVSRFSQKSLYSEERGLLDYLWIHYLGFPVDERPDSPYHCWQVIKQTLLAGTFPRVMDLLERLVTGLRPFTANTQMQNAPGDLRDTINLTLEDHLVGYRFVNDRLLRIDSEEEVTAIETAFASAVPLRTAHHHLTQAFAHLADRDSPDYRNVIKESIQAVESAVKTLTGQDKFANAVRALPAAGIPSHRALLGSWEKMYGWASDEDGLRHGGETVAEPDQALAKYVFGTSASFVAYLVEKSRQAGTLPEAS